MRYEWQPYECRWGHDVANRNTPKRLLKEENVIYDCVYNQLETRGVIGNIYQLSNDQVKCELNMSKTTRFHTILAAF